METEKRTKQISSQKLAANRANAQHSTGPKTEEGKRKSADNARRHGFCAKRLFSKQEQKSQDGKDYECLLTAVRDDYQPVGLWEEFWTEKIAIEAFRSVRILSYEQETFGSELPFELQAIDKILRYQAAVNRQLGQAMEQLKGLQEVRRAKEKQDPSCAAEVADPSRGQNEMEEQPGNEDQLPDGRDLSSSEDCGTNPTNCGEANPIGGTPTIENCGTNPTPIKYEGQELPLGRPVNTQGLGPDRRRVS
jgi:hypothetical protein